MAEKCTLDLSLLLPDIPDERDACAGRLTELLQAEGLEKVHLAREDGHDIAGIDGNKIQPQSVCCCALGKLRL